MKKKVKLSQHMIGGKKIKRANRRKEKKFQLEAN
jgi:hypothetical protein